MQLDVQRNKLSTDRRATWKKFHIKRVRITDYCECFVDWIYNFWWFSLSYFLIIANTTNINLCKIIQNSVFVQHFHGHGMKKVSWFENGKSLCCYWENQLLLFTNSHSIIWFICCLIFFVAPTLPGIISRFTQLSDFWDINIKSLKT